MRKYHQYKSVLILLSIFFVSFGFTRTIPKTKNISDWEHLNLNGKVKSIEEKMYSKPALETANQADELIFDLLYQFNDKGFLTEIYSFTTDGTYDSVRLIKYNDKNEIIKDITHGFIFQNTEAVYTYDNGYPIEINEQFIYEDLTINLQYLIKNNNFGDMQSKQLYKNGKLMLTESYEYDRATANFTYCKISFSLNSSFQAARFKIDFTLPLISFCLALAKASAKRLNEAMFCTAISCLMRELSSLKTTSNT